MVECAWSPCFIIFRLLRDPGHILSQLGFIIRNEGARRTGSFMGSASNVAGDLNSSLQLDKADSQAT